MEEINVIINNTSGVYTLQMYKILIDIRIKELNGLNNSNKLVTARQAVQ